MPTITTPAPKATAQFPDTFRCPYCGTSEPPRIRCQTTTRGILLYLILSFQLAGLTSFLVSTVVWVFFVVTGILFWCLCLLGWEPHHICSQCRIRLD